MLAGYLKYTESFEELDISYNHLNQFGEFLVKKALNLATGSYNQKIKLTL